MTEVFLGSEMVSKRVLTRSRLRWNHESIYPDVYVPKDVAPVVAAAHGGCLALDGSTWHRRRTGGGRTPWCRVHAGTPIELITPSTRPPRGIVTRDELISDDELVLIDGMAVTNPGANRVRPRVRPRSSPPP
ncbi:MAG TPA: hypothetical protein VI029_16015 [Mycobacterium sp.]